MNITTLLKQITLKVIFLSLPFYGGVGGCLGVVAGLFLFTSCSGSDYVNAIPSASTAIISIDATKAEGTDLKQLDMVKDFFKVTDPAEIGIDLTTPLYLFESADGNLGLCAKVDSRDKLDTTLDNLVKSGNGQKGNERNGCQFGVIGSSWVIGYSDNALLCMGPCVAAAQPEMIKTMLRYLTQDSDNGISGTPMFSKLNELQGPFSVVAQAQALPEKIAPIFTIGAPKDADASQVVIAADITTKDNVLCINGEALSFNGSCDKQIKAAYKEFRPITKQYLSSVGNTDLLGLFVNVNGDKFLPVLQQNKGLELLLAGINQAIDMNNIIKSIDGDMVFALPSISQDNLELSMAAKLANSKFLADVDYWKESCPEGGKITNWKPQAYCYSAKGLTFFFGVTNTPLATEKSGGDCQFFSGSTPERAEQSISSATNPLPQNIQSAIEGNKMAVIMNLSALPKESSAVTSLISPLFGNINTILYTVK